MAPSDIGSPLHTRHTDTRQQQRMTRRTQAQGLKQLRMNEPATAGLRSAGSGAGGRRRRLQTQHTPRAHTLAQTQFEESTPATPNSPAA